MGLVPGLGRMPHLLVWFMSHRPMVFLAQAISGATTRIMAGAGGTRTMVGTVVGGRLAGGGGVSVPLLCGLGQEGRKGYPPYDVVD